MYNLTIAHSGLRDPFKMKRSEKHTMISRSLYSENDPRYQLNNPAYMREVTRSYADSMPGVVVNNNRYRQHGEANKERATRLVSR